MVRFIKPKKKTEPTELSAIDIPKARGIISMATERDQIAKSPLSEPVNNTSEFSKSDTNNQSLLPNNLDPSAATHKKEDPELTIKNELPSVPPLQVFKSIDKSDKEEALEHKLADLQHKLHDVEELLHKEQEKHHDDIVDKTELSHIESRKNAQDTIIKRNVKVSEKSNRVTIWQQLGIVLSIALLIVGVVFVQINWRQPVFSSAIILQASTEDKPVDLMLSMMGVDGLQKYLFRPAFLRSFIETQEEFKDDKSDHQRQLNSYLEVYRENLILTLDKNRKKIILNVSSNDPQKTAVLTKILVQSYIKVRLLFVRLDETQVLFKRTVQDLLKAQDDDWAFAVSDEQKVFLDQLNSQEKTDMQTQMTQIQIQISKIQERLLGNSSLIKKQLVLKADSREMYIFNALKFKLIQMEFYKMSEPRTYSSIIGESSQDKIISKIKSTMVDIMRKTSANKISLEKEEILAIYMRKIFLELKLKSMLMLQNNSYGLEESFSSGQREFSFKIKKLNEIIDKYQAYLADAHKIILEANHPKLVLPASQTEKNYWVKAFSKNNQKTYIQWFGIGLLIGMLGVVFNNAIGYYLVKSENKSK